MSLDLNVSVKGIRNVEKAIMRLAPELQKAAYKSVMTAGARVVRSEARTRVPKADGTLKRSLGLKVKIYGNTPYAVVGPRYGIKGKSRVVISRKTGIARTVTPWPVKYAHLVEKGTVHSAPQPFIRPALDASRGKVHSAFRSGLEKHLHRTARRLAKQRAK